MKRSKPKPKDGGGDKNLPNLKEAERVASYIVTEELRKITDAMQTTSLGALELPDAFREFLALTIAVSATVEHFYRLFGKQYPDHWESLEHSAQVLNDHGLLKLWDVENESKRGLKRQRRRRLERRAGVLHLVESNHATHARWATVALPDDAPVPVAENVREGLPQAAELFERRVQACLDASPLPLEPLVFCGQIVGLLCAAEFLLSVFPKDLDDVAAFCVRIAVMQVEHELAQEKA